MDPSSTFLIRLSTVVADIVEAESGLSCLEYHYERLQGKYVACQKCRFTILAHAVADHRWLINESILINCAYRGRVGKFQILLRDSSSHTTTGVVARGYKIWHCLVAMGSAQFR